MPKWMDHPNGTTGICQVTVMAPLALQPRVRARFAGLYGAAAIMETSDGFAVSTGNGHYVVGDRAFIERSYGALPASLGAAEPPFCVAIHIRTPDLARVLPFLTAAGVNYRLDAGRAILLPPEEYGNMFLVFNSAPPDEPAHS